MWTKESVKQFLVAHPIETNDAISDYKITDPTEQYDGDEWLEVLLPFWPQNSTVVVGVLKLLLAAAKQGDVGIYPQGPRKGFRVCFHTHFCYPD
jgi:hypothetical protein